MMGAKQTGKMAVNRTTNARIGSKGHLMDDLDSIFRAIFM
jgi:hypothetical protein